MESLVIASGKGGVGKSTVTTLLGRALSTMDQNVLLVDGDAGLNALDILLNVRDKVIFGWNDALKGVCTMEQACIQVNDSLSLLPSPGGIGSEIDLKKIMEFAEGRYDYILVDAPAGIGRGFINSVRDCDKAIFIATPDEICVDAAMKASIVAERIGLPPYSHRMIVNRYDARTAKSKKLLTYDGMIDKTGVRLLGVVPESKQITCISVTNEQLKISHPVIQATRRIAWRLLGRPIPLGGQ